MLRIAENGPEPNAAKRNGQHIIKSKAITRLLTVADALQAEHGARWPGKQSKIEVA
jgi:hypothetical protein